MPKSLSNDAVFSRGSVGKISWTLYKKYDFKTNKCGYANIVALLTVMLQAYNWALFSPSCKLIDHILQSLQYILQKIDSQIKNLSISSFLKIEFSGVFIP